jgi:ABC-type transport system involved in multi-copper enzyme maturation permease subunit
MMKLHFLGPVCYYDMIRAARRGRYFLIRSLYALGLVSLLCLMYGEYFSFEQTQLRPQNLSRFAEGFFYSFMSVQFFLALLLTPAYVAGAIAEEKERKTLEFLLATDLQGQEIVFNKLASRLANVTLFLLAGLPVLSLIQLFGGVSPQLLWCGFAATALAVFSTACLCILVSVYVLRVRDAVVRSSSLVFGYYLVGLMVWWLYMVVQGGDVLTAKLTYDGMTVGQKSFAWTLEALLSGHALFVVFRAFEKLDFTGIFPAAGPVELLRNFAAFHLTLALLCLCWACLRVRNVFLRQSYGAAKKESAAVGRRRRPAVGERPLLWKERFVESAARLTKGVVIFYVVCALLALAPLGIITHFFVLELGPSRLSFEDFRGAINVYVRIAGTILALMLLLGIGVRAASAVASERDRQTMDSLLASPLTLGEIRAAKWFGAILGAKWMFLLLTMVWAIGLLSGGLHVLALPILLAALGCYAAFMASLGLYFSVWASTTNRAVLWTVGLALFFGGGHWLVCASPTLIVTRGSEYMAYFFAGLTPAWVLGLFAFSYQELGHGVWGDRQVAVIAFCLVGIGVAAAAALLLWGAAAQRFLASSGRIPPGYWPRRSPWARAPEEV